MNILLDLLVILIVVLFAFVGKTKGFVKTFFGFFGSIISFIFASVFAKPIGTFLSEKAIFPVLKKYFLATLSEKAGEKIHTFDYQSLSETAKEFLLRFQISEEKVQSFSISAQDSFAEAGEKMAETVLTPFSESIGYAIAYITLFIVFSIAIRILVKVFNLFDKLPIIRFSNQPCFMLFFGENEKFSILYHTNCPSSRILHRKMKLFLHFNRIFRLIFCFLHCYYRFFE